MRRVGEEGEDGEAVIAIENVRLFTELEARNRDLTEALEQQTATSEILRVISQSQTDVQPVFDTIAERAALSCAAPSVAVVYRFDGETIRLAAIRQRDAPKASRHCVACCIRADRAGTTPRPAARSSTCSVVHIAGRARGPRVRDRRLRAHAPASAASLGVPLVRDGEAIGAIASAGPNPGHFPTRRSRC